MPVGRYEITKNPNGTCFFRLVGANGKAVAHSGVYSCVAVCKKGIASLRINSDAPLLDMCGDSEGACASDGSSERTVGRSKGSNSENAERRSSDAGAGSAVRTKNPKIELYSEKNAASIGSYNFALYARNGSVIVTGEGYGTKKRCLEAIDTLRYIAFSANVRESGF